MPILKKLLTFATCLATCLATFNTVCFVEEQSTVPQRAYNVTTRVPSYRMCILYCEKDPKVEFAVQFAMGCSTLYFEHSTASLTRERAQLLNCRLHCKSVSYSDSERICHLQMPADQLMCAVTPFRRFVKTNQNCVGEDPGVTYARSDTAREHGVDPCVPMALLHPESPPSLNPTPPVCPVRKLDGSQGPLLYLRTDGNGKYTSFGINNNVWMSIHPGTNAFRVDYKTDAIPSPHTFISGFCAEENPDDDCCPPLPPYTASAIAGKASPRTSGQGACPGQKLYATIYKYSAPFNFNGNDAKLFSASGFWLAGDYNHGADGHTYRLDTGSCGN